MNHLKLCQILVAASVTATAGSAVAQCDSAEVGYVATFQVKPGSEAAFEAALSQLATTVNEVETGVILYAPYRGNEGKYFMMERYADEASRQAHGKDPKVAALFPGLGAHMAGAPDVQPVSAVCP